MIASLLFGLVAGSGLTWAFLSLRRDHYRHECITRRCGGGEITLAQWEAMRTSFTEGRTQRGNGNGGPATPKPEIVPKPVPTSGRNPFVSEFQQQINNALNLDGYQPRPSRPGANPPPSEP